MRFFPLNFEAIYNHYDIYYTLDILRALFFHIHKVWNNFPYFTGGFLSDQMRMRVKAHN